MAVARQRERFASDVHAEAQGQHAAGADHSAIVRGAERKGIVHFQEAVVHGRKAGVDVRSRETDFAHAVLGDAAGAKQLRVNPQIGGEEMAGDINDRTAEHAHAAADNGLGVGVAIHRDVARGQDAARAGRVHVAAVENQVVNVFAETVQVEEAGSVDGDVGVIGKLTAMQVAHHIGVFRQFILTDDQRTGHRTINDHRRVLVQQQRAILHRGRAAVGVGVGAGKRQRAGAQLGETAGASDLAIEEQRARTGDEGGGIEKDVAGPNGRAAGIEITTTVNCIDSQILIGNLHVTQKQIGVTVDDRARGSAQRCRGGAQCAIRQQHHLAIVDGSDAVVGVSAREK